MAFTTTTMLPLREQERRLTRRLKYLIIALVLTAVPLAIALAILPRLTQRTIRSLEEGRLVQIADDLAAFTQKTMEQQLETVCALATQPSIRSAISRHNAGLLTADEIVSVNRELYGFIHELSTELQGVMLCGQDGVSFAGTLQTGDTSPYVHLDLHNRSYFVEVKRTMKPLVSDPLRSYVRDVPVVVVLCPIIDEKGAFAGALGFSIKIEHLSRVIAERKIGKTGYPFAVDREGILVAHPDARRFYSDALISRAKADRLVVRMLNKERGVEAYVSSIGASKVAAFAPAPICGWSLAASIDVAEFEEPVAQIRWILTVLLVACLLIGFVIAGTLYFGIQRLNLALNEATASADRFSLVAKIAGGAIWDWDLVRDQVWWSDGLAATFGWEPAQLATFSEFAARLLPEERERVIDGISRKAREGLWIGEHHFLRPDGSASYLINRAAAIRSREGRVIRIMGSITDISDRQANEQKIAEQADLLNRTRDSIILKGLDHTIRFWNAGARQLYGWSAEDAIGRRHDELLSVDKNQYKEATEAVLAHGTWLGRLKKVTKSGQRITVECRWSLLRDAANNPKAILSIGTDITDRLLMEEKLYHAQRLESIGTLAGGIAHDLNNLLAPILAGAGLLKTERLSGGQAEVVELMEQSAKRGANLVKQVLTFARGVRGSAVSVHAGYVLREVEAIVRSTFPKNIAVHTRVAEGLDLIQADPTQINQVMLNLCVNARDAMPEGGSLGIDVSNFSVDAAVASKNSDLAQGAYICITVSDTGTGIPEDLRAKIFEPFFTTKGPNQGTGLGLSTVLGIVRGLGGAVTVYSEPGRGSVFRVFLPSSRNPDPLLSATEQEQTMSKGGGETVLLVDDEPLNLDVGKRALELHGYRVLTSQNGVEALELFQANQETIALLLTDVMMPRMDGKALAAAVWKIRRKLPVIFMSGLNDPVRSSEAEGGAFLEKPFTVSSLVAAVRRALQRPPERPVP